jgi:cardiolipin synthase
LGQPRLATTLIEKAREPGMDVHVILGPVDPSNRQDLPKARLAAKMQRAGVDVRFYPVLPEGGPHRQPQLDHIKMLLVDGDSAVMGGMNWGANSERNHDVDVLVEGPAVLPMEALFAEDYRKCGGDPSRLWANAAVPVRGEIAVGLRTTSERPEDRGIQRALLGSIGAARNSIAAELFCLTDHDLQTELIKAHDRGVDVRLLLEPRVIRNQAINLPAADNLMDHGVQVRWRATEGEQMLHAKLGIFDGQEVIVGSANWSANALTWNHEADVDVLDQKTASAFTAMFEQDWQKGIA